MRQIVLDTETTGIETALGHRIIEIGCVEMINRRLTGRHYHQYVNPQREVDAGAFQVHGISNEFLSDKPLFSQIVDGFLEFVGDADLIIHNAAFDVGFLNYEFSLLPQPRGYIETRCKIIDSLLLARAKHPGQKHSLDALCKRYGVDNSQRELHGALLDSEILADVYLLMTGGQTALSLGGAQSENKNTGGAAGEVRRLAPGRARLPVILADDASLLAHSEKLESIQKASGGKCIWLSENV